MSIKIYTKTKHHKNSNGNYIPKMMGVIEGPVHHMLLHFPKEFSFIRHFSTRSLRPSKKDKK
tara:strand:- start:151 stop:336 length:186 start_codon:yes stop_codon:yes gene_type:complete